MDVRKEDATGESDLDVTVDLVVSGEGDPSSVVLSARNAGDETVDVGSQPPPPFGILRMWPDVGDGEPIYLWTESYDRSLHITTRDFTAAVHNDVGLIGIIVEAHSSSNGNRATSMIYAPERSGWIR